MMLVGEMVKRNAKLLGNKVGLIDGKESFTYKEINERINRLSNALKYLGLKKGDRVSIIANNCHEFIEVYFAIAKGGYVVVPINSRLSAEEASYLMNNSGSLALIYHEEFKDVVSVMRTNIPAVKHIISIGDNSEISHSYESLLFQSSPEEPDVNIRPDDLMMIMYTSGSTGAPKGVMATHRNIMANTNTMVLELRIVPEDVNLLVMPLYHSGGFWPTMTHFYRGAQIYLLPKFDVEKVLHMVHEKGATLLNLVPTMLKRIISHPQLNEFNLKSLRLIMYAGAPITMELLKEAMQVLGQHRFYTSLGCTEANGMVTSFPTTEHFLDGPLTEKLGSVGKDGINVEVKIVDGDGKEVPSGKAGEIILKGDNVSPGYWGIAEETEETFRNGWLYTGDLGYRDSDGYIFIIDRKKDIIISGGENVSSKEVEGVIQQHSAVNEAAVIGVADKEWGEAVMAVVSLKPQYKGKVTEEEIISFCKARLAGYKRPKSAVLVDEIPKNSAGKIAKAELKRIYRGNVGSLN